IRKVTKKFRRVDTQGDRAELIKDLKVILEVYKKHAAKTGKPGPPGKLEMKSAQLAAYIARSINIIARGYDAVKIKTILAELAERVSKLEQLQKRDKESGEKGRKPRKKG
nr:hypothetical protein [Anaerolineales bacterium]